MVVRPMGRRWSTQLRHGAVAVAALALLAAGCAGGPAAGQVEQGDSSGGQDSAGSGHESEEPDPTATNPVDDGGTDDGKAPVDPDPPADPDPPPAEGSAEVMESYPLDDLVAPWGLAALPDGDLLIGDRATATIYRFHTETADLTEVGEVPTVKPGEDDLLGVVAHGRDVYAYYESGGSARVGRFPFQENADQGDQLGAFAGVQIGLPRTGALTGGKIAISDQGLVYATVGNGTGGESSYSGALLRTTQQGNAPSEGNVAAGSPVYVAGEPGIADFSWDSVGRLWGVDTEGALRVLNSEDDAPVVWDSGRNPGHLTYAEGSLWMPELDAGQLWRVPLDGDELVAEPQALPMEYDSLQALLNTEDGVLWALADSELLKLAVS